MKPQIALLDASHGNPDARRNFRRELDADLTEFPVTEGRLPPTFDFDAVVITGSRSSVYAEESWIDETRAWVASALERDLPALGICWGHQLLADIVGGRVEPMGEYELGYRTVTHDGDDIFEGIPTEFTVFTTHSDVVVELPEAADVIATNDYGIHGFRAGDVVGIQSHPEYDAATAERVVRRKDLPDDRIESVCTEITAAAAAEAAAAKQLFENFERLVRSRRPDAPEAPSS
ncbi:MAG: type 1 glutamine amidotransferase [Natronomonas sp.]